MRDKLLLVLVLAGAYALGTLQGPAQADDHTVENLLRDMARAQQNQADSLKVIARSSEKCAR